jgi:hypothetical protein
MKRIQIACSEGMALVFDVIFCDNPEEFGEWAPDHKLAAAAFYPNQDDLDELNKLGTLVFSTDSLEAKHIISLCTKAGMLFAEVVTTFAEIQNEEEKINFFRESVGESTASLVSGINNFLKDNFKNTLE